MQDRVDIIQISLIDTWAATASGAFVLTENSLYTLEAWRIFLDHLAPRGMLSVSRWYYADRPGEVYRLASLASTTLHAEWVSRVPAITSRSCARVPRQPRTRPDGIGTMLVSRDPFSAADLDALEAVAARMHFEIVQSPRIRRTTRSPRSPTARACRRALRRTRSTSRRRPTTRPFFFHMLRLRDVFNIARWHDQGIVRFNMTAVGVLGVLLVTVTLLTGACIVLAAVLLGAVERRSAAAATASRLLRRDRLRVHAGRDLAGAAADDLSRPSRLQPRRSCCSRCCFRAARAASSTARVVDRSSALVDDGSRASCLLCLSASARVTPLRLATSIAASTPMRIAISVAILLPHRLFHGHGISDWHAPRAVAKRRQSHPGCGESMARRLYVRRCW